MLETVGVSGTHPETTTGGAGELDELAGSLVIRPDPRTLGELELLLSGAAAPLRGFLGQADADAVTSHRRLADGTPWPLPFLLEVPAADLPPAGPPPRVVIEDLEQRPVAVLDAPEAWPGPDGTVRLAGEPRPLRPLVPGPFRRLRLRPEQVRRTLGRGPVLAVVTDAPLLQADLTAVCESAAELGARVLVVALVAEPGAWGLPPEGLVRTLLAAGPALPEDSVLVAVPLPHVGEPVRRVLASAHVAAAYGATHLLADPVAAAAVPVDELPLPLVRSGAAPATAAEVLGLLDAGRALPGELAPRVVAEELALQRPPRHRRGFTVFLTGLSGSGKSTIARALHEALLEVGRPRVTLLDGDVVRRLLSSGLTFTQADRELNLRRIGFVAAEITRHGGICICAPIAPYARTRAEIRAMVEGGGGFVLVHVATPLEECERRDVKGLYAKARAGEIKGVTGIDDPYEEPVGPEVVCKTGEETPEESADKVIAKLIELKYLEA